MDDPRTLSRHLTHCLCGGVHLDPVAGGVVCLACGHVLLAPPHDAPPAGLDDASAHALRARFDALTAPGGPREEASGWVRRVTEFAAFWLISPELEGRPPRALEVDATDGVFAWALAEEGWQVTALHADARRAELVAAMACVPTVTGEFLRLRDVGRFDVVALPDVLAVLVDPAPTLARTGAFLESGGMVYLEVPDADTTDGAPWPQGCLHAFSHTSVAMLVGAAGLAALRVDRVRRADGVRRFGVFCTLAEPPGPADERRALRQIAVANPSSPAAAWAAIEDPQRI